MKHVFLCMEDLEEHEYTHGSGEDQDSHGLMVIISEDHIVIGICSGGFIGKIILLRY